MQLGSACRQRVRAAHPAGRTVPQDALTAAPGTAGTIHVGVAADRRGSAPGAKGVAVPGQAGHPPGSYTPQRGRGPGRTPR